MASFRSHKPHYQINKYCTYILDSAIKALRCGKKEKIEHQKEHFNKIASEYYISRSDRPYLVYKYLLWEFVFSKTPAISKTNLSVSESMCGYAEGKKLIEEVYASNVDYEGFDYGNELVRIVKHQNPKLDIHVADITTYRFEKIQCDYFTQWASPCTRLYARNITSN